MAHCARDGKEIHLGPTEFRLLDYLMQHPGRRVQPRTAAGRRSGARTSHVEARTVDVHIGRLRKALNGKVRDGDPIRTVRSAGRVLRWTWTAAWTRRRPRAVSTPGDRVHGQRRRTA
ncbi:winged helix-turn-helix domain-containing protein [Caulobacter segnis]